MKYESINEFSIGFIFLSHLHRNLKSFKCSMAIIWKLFKVLWQLSKKSCGLIVGRNEKRDEIMMRWSWVKRWNIIVNNCWQNIIIKAVIIAIAYDYPSFLSAPSSRRLELKTGVKMYVFVLKSVFKILIIYHAKDLWRFFESLDTFLLQHASESFTVYDNNWSVQHSVLCRSYQTSISRFLLP